jgi:hypothetical protein
MRAPVFALMAAVLMPIAACDLSQKPQTGSLRVGGAHTARQQTVVPPAPEFTGDSSSRRQEQAIESNEPRGDRSIRLYGPGVSRTKQTRV